MKNCGIVCEYNPFHTGHKYQIDTVRSFGIDNIFCVMSGAFVQSAMPAFCSKEIRAECAVMGGADAVAELPTVYSTASAQVFAEGAVKILSEIKDLTNIAMGAVSEPSVILKLADIKISHRSEFEKELKTRLNDGKSYNAATALALACVYDRYYPADIDIQTVFSDPNNILCIEYITAIHKFAANIEPMIIARKGAAYNDTACDGEYVSATAIRNAETCGRLDEMSKYIPYDFQKISDWRERHAPDMNAYKKTAVFSIKSAEPEYLKSLRNCSEGLEYLLKKISYKHDYDDYIEYVSGKRYGKKRIARLMLDAMLGIDKSLTEKRFCTRLLACKSKFDFSLLPRCVKSTNVEIKNAALSDTQIRDVLDIDIKATALFNTLCETDGDYFNYSLIKV